MALLNKKVINQLLRSTFQLNWNGEHGASHWARVCNNGRQLACAEGANQRVIFYFSLFHDMARVNDGFDSGHGLRAAQYLESLGGATFLGLHDDEFIELYEAMQFHSDSKNGASLTQKVCWDADRLDLWRVGIMPDPDRLYTETGKKIHFDRLFSDFYT